MSIIRPLLILMIAPLAIAEVGAAELEDQRDDPSQVEQPAPKRPPYQTGRPAVGHPAPTPVPPSGLAMEPRRPASINPQSAVPRWLEEVRAQRRALREQRRAAHQARLESLDPIGSAKRDERKERRRRRQEEVRDLIETERRLYLNRGPWFSPLAPRPPPVPEINPLSGGSFGAQLDPQEAALDEEQPANNGNTQTPPDWNNLWYYNGW